MNVSIFRVLAASLTTLAVAACAPNSNLPPTSVVVIVTVEVTPVAKVPAVTSAQSTSTSVALDAAYSATQTDEVNVVPLQLPGVKSTEATPSLDENTPDEMDVPRQTPDPSEPTETPNKSLLATEIPAAAGTIKPVTMDGPGCTFGDAKITSPVSNSIIRGIVPVYGTVTCNEFRYYKFEFEDARCARGVCFVAGPPAQCNNTKVICPAEYGFTRPVVDGLLMNWDTRTVPNGTYVLRLVAVGAQGRILDKIARVQITIQN